MVSICVCSHDELCVSAVGAFNFTRTNHTLVCLPDPFQEESGKCKSLSVMHLSCSVFGDVKRSSLPFCSSESMDAGSSVSVAVVCGTLATLAAAAAIAHYFGLIRLLPAPPATALTSAQLLALQSPSELSSAHGSPYPIHSSGATPSCRHLIPTR